MHQSAQRSLLQPLVRFCRRIASEDFASDGHPAVDVERGVWKLVSEGQIALAAEILATG
ncbi:MAG: hypothetical protein L6435_08440 [Anaerolineae bacterium]|nr:hypothetical protein [Anaerolineae bacterium]